MKYIIGLKTTFNNVFFVGLSLVLMIWLSVFLYGLFYYLYIPAVAHARPVFLQFDTSCQAGICGFPTANVTLVKRGQSQLLTRGQAYKILLDLEMPESEVNQRLGMFMVKLSMYSENGEILKSSFRSALLVYKSPILRYMHTLLFAPFLLTDISSEKQLLTVSLFENYEEDPYKSTYGCVIEIHSKFLEIYSAALRIHADFTGVRYLMYYWPGLSATVGISTNFYFLVMIALFSWYRFLAWKGSPEMDNLPIRKLTPQSKTSTPVPLNKSGRARNISAISVGANSSPNKPKEAFEYLKRLSFSPEHDNSPIELSASRMQAGARVLEVGMSTIEEEDSLDITPLSAAAEDGQKFKFDADTTIRKRK